MVGVFKYDFVTNFLLSLTVKTFCKSVNLWRSYGQEYSVFFLTHSVQACRLLLTSSADCHQPNPFNFQPHSHPACYFQLHINSDDHSLILTSCPQLAPYHHSVFTHRPLSNNCPVDCRLPTTAPNNRARSAHCVHRMST